MFATKYSNRSILQELCPALHHYKKIMPSQKVTIEINTAFKPDAGLKNELARILRKLADELENGKCLVKLKDVNENTVGNVCVYYEI